MTKITIYGKENCPNCQLAKQFLPNAEYLPHGDLFDRYDLDTATNIVTSSGGNLPIIIIEGPQGRLVLSLSNATQIGSSNCVDGVCRI